jgi:TonB family protein
LSLFNLASLYQLQGSQERAGPVLKRAVLIQQNAPEPNYPVWAESLEALSDLYLQTNQLRHPCVTCVDSLLVALYKPLPVYPADLVKEGVGDQMVLEFFIDEEGAVQLPHIVEAKNDELAWIALTAVSRWYFEPPLREGRPVITRVRLPMTFSPSK